MEIVKSHKVFDGRLDYVTHQSHTTGTKMTFTVFVPPGADAKKVPVVYWLSGLTCTEENFTTKAGAYGHAARLGLVVVAPDTSPRGAGIPGEDDSWDFGTGAGFYVNATQDPWAKHYRMYDYVLKELPELVESHYPVSDRRGISGHSMGGHGALVLGLRNPDRFRSISAFAPICSPTRCPWGEKALSGYLGEDREAWKDYDATELIKRRVARTPLLVDQGTADGFLTEQLKPELLREACREADHPLDLRLREGYDHSYFFIATFIGEHLAYHAERLR